MNYDIYRLSKKEVAVMVLQFSIAVAVLGRLFYGSALYGIILFPLVVFFYKWKEKKMVESRKKQLKYQFRDAINSIADLLSVGYSVESSLRECHKEMAVLHGKESIICKEMTEMIRKTDLNVPVEKLFFDLGKRSGVYDIKLFGQIFYSTKRTGGNLISVINLVSKTISQGFEVEEEVSHIVGEKKLESSIMNVAPIAMLGYIGVTGSGMMEVMYQTIMGKLIMTVCLAVYFGTIVMSSMILKINYSVG